MIPFPHVLTEPTWRNDQRLRIVSDIHLTQGNVVYCPDRKKNYLIEFVTSFRPARGDWSAYPEHPTYYECIASTFIQLPTEQKPPEKYEPKQAQVFPIRPVPAA